MFYLLAQRPEMAEVIRPIIQIAPITRLTHARHPVRNLSANILLKQLLRTMSEININNRLTNFAIDIICRSQYIFLPMICGNVMKLAMGHHNEMNYTRLPVYLKHFPDSTSALNLMHFSQMIQSPQLHMFNFGSPQQNQQCYSQPEPPIIDYTRIRSNDIHLIYSSDDMFSDVKDIEEFKKSVPGNFTTLDRYLQVWNSHFECYPNPFNSVRMSEYKVPVKKWSHIDFMISKDLDKYTNQVVLNRINSHFDNENVILSTEPKPVIPSYSHETCRAQTKCELGNHEWQT